MWKSIFVFTFISFFPVQSFAQSWQSYTADVEELGLTGLMAHLVEKSDVIENGYLVQKTPTGIDIATTNVIMLDGYIQPDVVMVFERPIKVPEGLTLQDIAVFNANLISSDTKLVADYTPQIAIKEIADGFYTATSDLNGTPVIILEYQADLETDATYLRTIYYEGDRAYAFTCIVFDPEKFKDASSMFVALNILAVNSDLMWTEPHINDEPIQ